MFEKTILCIGAGYVGGPTMAMIAYKCQNYKVIVADINKERIDAWQTDSLPIYEPGLLEIVKKVVNKNLFFTTDVKKSIKDADIIFVSVNTPTKTFGVGAGMASDLKYWEKVARDILENSDKDKIVVEKSTLPVRTAEAMDKILNGHGGKYKFEIISNPEFLAEGTAIKDLESPDRILIGGNYHTETGKKAIEEMVAIYANWVPREKILTTNVWSSELSKLTANAFLAQRISSINSISAIAEKTEADVDEVSRAIGADSRIGSKFLCAGIGFGGSCFKKDILNLVYLCHHYNLPEVANYWHSVVKMNDYQKDRFVNKIISSMFNTIVGKRIAIFGFAFKTNTGDTRETPAISVCQKLLDEDANIVVTDPAALENAKKDMEGTDILFEEDPYAAAKGAHAIVVLTGWDEYKNLDYKKIFDSMEKPAFIFDGRNCLDHDKLFNIGFEVHAIGKNSLIQK